MIYFLAFLSGVVLSPLFSYFPYSGALLGVLAAAFFYKEGRRLAVALLIAGLVYPALREAPGEGLPFKSGSITASGYFSEPAVTISKGYAQEFELAGGGGRIEVLSDEEFEVGREHEINLRIITPYERNNPGELKAGQFAVLGFVRSAGDIHPSAVVQLNRLRDRLNRIISDRFEPETASLVMAVTTGHRADMSYGLKEAFRASGVAHLLSISGTHFGLMFLLLFGSFRVAIKYLPMRLLERLTVYLTPSQAAALLCMPFLVLYLGISGMRVPTVRSFIMISLFLFGLLVGRKGGWLTFLVLAAVVLVLWDPEVIASVSFQLSFLAVLFIGVFLGGKRPREEEDEFGEEEKEPEKRWRSALRYPLKSVGITVAATLGVEPIVAYYFHYSSTVSPLANLIVTPLVCMVLVPLSVAGSFAYLLTGSFVFAPIVERAASASIYLVRTFESVPYSSIPVPAFPSAVLVFYYSGFLLYFASRRKGLLALPALSVLVPLAVFAASEKTLSFTFLDAGRGDSSVVELPDGTVMVVDTGSKGREARGYLRRKGIHKIDALVLTHQDRYHTGGAAALAWQFDASEVWDNGGFDYPADFPTGPARRSLSRGDVIRGEGYSISVLHPAGGRRAGKRGRDNDSSLVMRISGGGRSVLFTGDVGAAGMRDILGHVEDLGSDVVKLSDNGRWEESHAAFINAVSPSVVVARGRPDERIGKDIGGARVLYSYTDGAVRVVVRESGLEVKTYAGDARLVKTRRVDEEIRNIGKLFTAW